MRATLEFDLNEEDDRRAFERACDADQMNSAIELTFDTLRRKLKYEELSVETRKALEEVREQLRENVIGCKSEF